MKKVLVVDDNLMNRNIIKRLLAKFDVEASCIESGAEALKTVVEIKYDMILLDYMMPGMDGIETFRNMKVLENNLNKDTPIIMLTADTESGSRENFINEGFDDYLAKPIVPNQLKNLLDKYSNISMEETRNGIEFDTTEDAVYSEQIKGDMLEKTTVLPDIDEFEWDYALLKLKDTDILLYSCKNFYNVLENIEVEYSDILNTINTDIGLTNYRISVHGLKSTAATVGALIISKLARLLEIAAKNENRERIYVLHPILLEEIVTHKDRLRVLIDTDGQQKDVTEDYNHLVLLLNQLASCIEEFDDDGMDAKMAEINQCRYDDLIQSDIDRLADRILNLDTDTAVTIIDIIKSKINTI